MITVTPKAVDKIREQFAKHGVKGGLRLGVLGGGCSGLSYLFKFDVKPRPTDKVFEFDDVKVFVDATSAMYLNGCVVGYVETLEAAGFKFENPNVKSTCGCGSSFSV